MWNGDINLYSINNDIILMLHFYNFTDIFLVPAQAIIFSRVEMKIWSEEEVRINY